MWWSIPLCILAITSYFIIPLIIEMKMEHKFEKTQMSGKPKSGKMLIIKKENEMSLENYNEIFEKRADGMCQSCGWGFDRCLEDGRAHCLDDYPTNISEELNEEVNKDVKKESV